ncbi:hypothetical protein ACF0H5_000856 [Mactra antiquata]
MAWSTNKFEDLQIVNRQMTSGGNGMLSIKRHCNTNRQNRHVQMNQQKFPSMQPTNVGGNGGVAKLATLNIGTSASVIGVVIAKESSKSIISKKSGNTRFLLGFVIRDTPTGFVNCTIWGSEHFISDVTSSFIIGDVVKLENVQVQAKATDGSDEKFHLSTPFGYQLMLSENHSNIVLYNGFDVDVYQRLLYIPTKPNTDYYTLEDVNANSQALNGEHINLLVAIRKIGEPREINTKNGRKTKRCEIKLFDETCSSFPLILWGEETVNYALTWSACQTVLFIADVRINFDDFRSCMKATADYKTIFTPNPETAEAKYLHGYVSAQNFTDVDNMVNDQRDPPLEEIKDIIEIEQLATKRDMFSDYAVLYGVITKFDLDVDNVDPFLRRKCPKCKNNVTSDTGYQCSNVNCTQSGLQEFNSTGQVTQHTPEIDCTIPISISDYTGTVYSWLSGNILESLTGWSGQDLMQIAAEERTRIKWQFLLENCKFHIKILNNFKDSERLSVRVLSCCRCNPVEMVKNVP